MCRAFVLGFLALGCEGSDAAVRSEAALLSRAIDALREADNASKAPRLEALRAARCTEPDVCAVRSACLAGYELHVSALASLESAAPGVPEAGGASDLATRLEAARRDLARALELTARCADAQGEMVRKYRVRG